MVNSPEQSAGVIGQAIDLTGAIAKAQIANTASINLNDTMSFSLWIKDDGSTCSYCTMVQKFLLGTGYQFQRDGTTQSMFLRVDTSGGTSQNTGTISGVLDGAWHHIVWILDSGTRKGYKDGQLIVDNSYTHGSGFGCGTCYFQVSSSAADAVITHGSGCDDTSVSYSHPAG